MDIDKLIKICEMISSDAEYDAKKFDGKPFTGKIVAEYLGNLGAEISALSEIIKQILSEKKNRNYLK